MSTCANDNVGSAIYIPDNFTAIPMSSLSFPGHYADLVDSIMLPHGFVQDRVDRMAEEIFNDLQPACGEQGLHALCVLKGGYKFFTDLVDRLQSRICCHRSLKVTLEFIRAKSYQADKSTGKVKIVGLYDMKSLTDKTLLIVEDIVDTGHTLKQLVEHLQQYRPKTIKVASLLLKRTELHNGIFPDYIGFSVPNSFIVGYALDYNEHFRDLKHICVINEAGRKKFAVEAGASAQADEDKKA